MHELHLNNGCSYLPIESAIEGILLQPESAPLSSIESALQVRRSLFMSPDKDVMVVKSIGKLCCCKARDKATQTKLTYAWYNRHVRINRASCTCMMFTIM